MAGGQLLLQLKKFVALEPEVKMERQLGIGLMEKVLAAAT